jgi:hypothetical protein
MDVHPTKNGINRYWSIPKSTQDPDGSPSLGKTAPQLVSLLGTEEAMDYGWHQLFSESEVTWSNAAAIWVIGEDGDFDRNVKGYIYILGFQFQSISVGIVNKDMGICIYIYMEDMYPTQICMIFRCVWTWDTHQLQQYFLNRKIMVNQWIQGSLFQPNPFH